MLGGTRGRKKRRVARAFRERLKSQGIGFQLGGEIGDGNTEVSLKKKKKKKKDRGEKEKANGKEIPITLGERRLVPFFFIFLPVFVFLCLLLRPLLSVSSATSYRSGTRTPRDAGTRCTHVPGSFYRFLWFAWQSRGGVAGVALPLHQHATQNSLAYRRNRVAFSRLTYTYMYTYTQRTPPKVPVSSS